MNWVSVALIVVIGWLTWRGYVSGFVRELVSLCALIIAIPLAGLLYDDLGAKLEPIVDSAALANLIGFLGILGGVVVGGQVASHLLKRTVNLLNLGWADDYAGGAFGFLKGVLLCQVILLALVVFPRPDLRDDIDASAVATMLLDSAPMTLALLPGNFDDSLNAFLDGVSEGLEAAQQILGIDDGATSE